MKRWLSLSRLWTPFTGVRASVYAASASFYILLSLFPFAVLFLALVSFLPSLQDVGRELLGQAVPTAFLPLVDAVVESAAARPSATLLSLSVLGALWSASRGLAAITDGLNEMVNAPGQRHFVRRRLAASVSLLVLAVCLVILLGAYLFGQQLLSAFIRWLPNWAGFVRRLLELRAPFTLALLALLLTLIYKILPAKRLPLHCCVSGGCAAAIGWVLLSAIFSLYVNISTARLAISGGIGLAALAALWLHGCMMVLLFGCRLSKLLSEDAYHPIAYLRETISHGS